MIKFLLYPFRFMHLRQIVLVTLFPTLLCFMRYFSPFRNLVSSKITNYKTMAGVGIQIDHVCIETPKLDRREYNYIELSNGVNVVVVRDEISEKSSAALSVKTGAAFDPTDYPGMAHFTEHMLFLGTEKYPQENFYKDFLNKNGGSSNAATGMEYTTYMFDINHQQFDQALDIFSQFFKNPLLNPNATSREVRAVDAEDSKNRILDGRRVLQVTKSLINPSHPYSKFSTGNARTLAGGDPELYGPTTRAAMAEFYKTHYKSQNMAVTLVGPQSLADLERLAREHFEGIPSTTSTDTISDEAGAGDLSGALLGEPLKDRIVDLVSQPSLLSSSRSDNPFPTEPSDFTNNIQEHRRHPHYPFIPEVIGATVRLRPVQEIRDVSVFWPLPSTRATYRTNPVNLLAYILNYKGSNSAFALLQDKNWVSSVSAGSSVEFEDFSIFEISASLTTDGMEHWEEVRAALLAHIELIQKADLSSIKRIWSELSTAGALGFHFAEKDSAYSTAQGLAKRLHQFPKRHIVSGDSLLGPFDESLFKEFTQKLTLENSITILRSPEFSWLPLDNADYGSASSQESAQIASLKALSLSSSSSSEPVDVSSASLLVDVGAGPTNWERWYGVPYHLEKLSASKLLSCYELSKQYTGPLALPPPNRFLSHELLRYIPSVDTQGSVEGLSPSNDMIATFFKSQGTRPLKSAPPVKLNEIEEDTGVSSSHDAVWLSRDEPFNFPKGQLTVVLRTLGTEDGDPSLSIFGSVFTQRAVRVFAGAGTAGLGYSASVGGRGLGISVYGYHSKLPDLAEDIAKDVGSLDYWLSTDPGLFETCRERLERSIKSWWKQRPDNQADSLLSYLLQEGVWLQQEKLSAIQSLNWPIFQERIKRAFGEERGAITMHLHAPGEAWGDKEWAETIIRNAYSRMNSVLRGKHSKYVEIATPKTRARLLPRPKISRGEVGVESVSLRPSSEETSSRNHITIAMPVFNQEEVNSALTCYFQGSPTSPRNSAILIILRRLLGEPMFSELRTKKQLGYIVSLSIGGHGRGLGGVRGLSAKILSQRFSPLYMEDELGKFLESQEAAIAALTQDQLSLLTSSVVKSLLDPPLNYGQEADSFWGHIIDETPFDWLEQVIEELKSLTVKDVQNAANNWIFNPSLRSTVSVMLFGKPFLSELEKIREDSKEISQKDPKRVDNAAAESPTDTTASTSFFPHMEDLIRSRFSKSSGAGNVHLCLDVDELTSIRNQLDLFEN